MALEDMMTCFCYDHDMLVKHCQKCLDEYGEDVVRYNPSLDPSYADKLIAENYRKRLEQEDKYGPNFYKGVI